MLGTSNILPTDHRSHEFRKITEEPSKNSQTPQGPGRRARRPRLWGRPARGPGRGSQSPGLGWAGPVYGSSRVSAALRAVRVTLKAPHELWGGGLRKVTPTKVLLTLSSK